MRMKRILWAWMLTIALACMPVMAAFGETEEKTSEAVTDAAADAAADPDEQEETGGQLPDGDEEASEYQKERELDIRLHLSELDGLGTIDGPIYVTGHKSPDSDTVGSSIAYAALLRQLGYDARPVVLEEINDESEYILDTAGVEVPELLEDASGCNMVLVDHSDYEQSAEGLEDAHIYIIIDHHGDGSVRTGNQLVYDARPLGATAAIIWMKYRDYGLEPDPATALVMIGSIFSDTHFLQYDSTTFADREAVKALAAIAGSPDLDTFWKGMHEAALSYRGFTDQEIFASDYKEYESGGTYYGIGCISVIDEEKARDMADRMKQVMPEMLASTGMDMGFAQIAVDGEGNSHTYLVPSGEAAKEVLETAFGETAEFDGTSFILTPGVSRKKVVVPAIVDVLNAHPKE